MTLNDFQTVESLSRSPLKTEIEMSSSKSKKYSTKSTKRE